MENVKLMNKTAMILACVNHVLYDSIHKVVGCSPQLVYSVLSCHEKDYKPRYKNCQDNEILEKRKKKYTERVFKNGDEVYVNGDKRPWEVVHTGREVLSLRRGRDSKVVQKFEVA